MKKFALAAVLAAAASTSFAGGLEEPEIIIPEEPVETGTGSAWVIPVMLLAVIAAVAAN